MNPKNLKPFCLQAALAGEPVMLYNGMKAFVRHHETELTVEKDVRLTGFDADGYRRAWCEDGCYFALSRDSDYDIIGMWPKTRIINGFEVPAPESEELETGSAYYVPMLTNKFLYEEVVWVKYSTLDLRLLERGLVFLNADDAIANAKAMLGINPYEDSE